MEQRDFLIQAEDHILGEFNTPILDKEPIWKILNAHMTFIYAYKMINGVLEICRIPLEKFTEMLSKSNDDEEVFRHYYVIYLLDSYMYSVKDMNAYNRKMHDQQLSKKLSGFADAEIYGEDFYCDVNVSHYAKPCDFQCSDCELIDSDAGLELKDLQDGQKQDVLSSSTNKQKEKTIWNLKLHESINIEEHDDWVTRVPGGWLYRTHNTSTFVKYVERYLSVEH